MFHLLERGDGFRTFFDNAVHEGFISSGGQRLPLKVLLVVRQVVLQGVEVDGSGRIVASRCLPDFRMADGTDSAFEKAATSDSHDLGEWVSKLLSKKDEEQVENLSFPQTAPIVGSDFLEPGLYSRFSTVLSQLS